MSNKITRRKFIRQTGKAGIAIAGATALPALGYGSFFQGDADISVVQGPAYFQNTIKAIGLIGGMEKFVPRDSSVGLLINSDFEDFGAYVNPDISIAAVKMLVDAGASKITCLQVVKEEYWKRSALYDEYKDLLTNLLQVGSNTFPAEFNETDFVKFDRIEGAKSLKETEVVKAWLECDVFVNIPISKHHATTFLTGALKNTMGVSTRKANVTFHLGSVVRNDPQYLAQCIVDQNMLRKTDLCIVDATEFITTNGPNGPGEMKKEQKIVAGTDIVAIDALCSPILGYQPDEILTTVLAHESGLGTMDYSKLNVVEVTV